MKLFENLRKITVSKPKLSAIILSLILWLYVTLNKTFSENMYFTIVPINILNGKVISESYPEKVNVNLSGKGIDLLWLNLFWESDLQYNLDLINVVRKKDIYIKGDNSFTNLRFPSGYETSITLNYIISPDTIKVELDDLVTKEVGISEENIIISTQNGYTRVGKLKFTPDNFSVTGPAKIVRSLKEVLTIAKKYENRKTGIRDEIFLEDLTDGRLKYNFDQVSFKVDIQKIGEKDIANIPVTITGKPANLNIDVLPSTLTVTITGGIDHINNISVSDFSAQIIYDRAWVRGGEYIEDVSLKLPADIISHTISPKSFKILIR